MATVFTRPAVVARHELIAPDVERAQTFYRELLGRELEPGEAGFRQLDRPPHWLVYFEVADVDVVAAKVQSLGGTVFHGPEDLEGVGRYAVLADPEGAVFAAVTPGEPSGPRPRTVVGWDELDTPEVEAAKEFYREVLGWSVAEAMPGYWLFRAGEADVAGLMEKPAESPAPAWLTYLGVEDADVAAGRTTQLGGRVLVPPMQTEGVGRWAVLADPVGAVFAVLGPER